MTYMDNPPLRRPRRVERRPAGWRPDRRMVVIAAVVAEFPQFGVDEVVAEVRQRGTSVTRDFVRAVMQA